jgi:hypothetical protein
MLKIKGNEIEIKESLGIEHENQVVDIYIPDTNKNFHSLVDIKSGIKFPVQKVQQSKDKYFVFLNLHPFQQLTLLPSEKKLNIQGINIEKKQNTAIINNGKFSIEVPYGGKKFEKPCNSYEISGPIKRIKTNKNWRGKTYFDTNNLITSFSGNFIEEGPLRIIYNYKVEFTKGFYDALITVDVEQAFAKIDEKFETEPQAQLVWDFSDKDLPEKIFLLNATGSYTEQFTHYNFDHRIARLFCWTQYSQLSDLSDGFAFSFNQKDTIGFLSFDGGKWEGNKLNHLELWERRWINNDKSTRRMPFDIKADSFPSPEKIPLRGESICQPHFNIEGWLWKGRRIFGLLITDEETIKPDIFKNISLDIIGFHATYRQFDFKPLREEYKQECSLLRKIHTQHGMFSLQEMLKIDFEWQYEIGKNLPDFNYENCPVEYTQIFIDCKSEKEKIKKMIDYLKARIYGFWDYSGCSAANSVVNRSIAHFMLYFEWCVHKNILNEEEKNLCKNFFIFLTSLCFSDNYYPGLSTMLPVNDHNSVEPTLAGMANQNFYTDVINLCGMAGQIFYTHPSAKNWRDKFINMWHRQLAYHTYPNSGLWEESHTYYQHVLSTVLPTFLRRKADGIDNEFENPKFQKMVSALLKQISPKDIYANNLRYIIPFGDHGMDTNYTYKFLYKEYAKHFYPHNSQLSKNLYYVYKEMGGTDKLDIPQEKLPWINEYVEGLGFIFRGIDLSEKESMFVLRSGCAWAHHHNDDGSIYFNAFGRALIVDAGFGLPKIDQVLLDKGANQYHSVWQPDGFNTAHYLWRFNRGWIEKYEIDKTFSYAVAYNPAFMYIPNRKQVIPFFQWIKHYRKIIQITPDTYILIDISNSLWNQSIIFHIPQTNLICDKNKIKADYKDCVLEIIQVVPEKTNPETSVIKADKERNEITFYTISIRFNIELGNKSICIISANKPKGSLNIEKTEHEIFIEKNGIKYSIPEKLLTVENK